MQPAVQIAWILAAAALLVAVLRRSGWLRLAVPVTASDLREGPGVPEGGDDDEQLPETDRAPRRSSHLLACAVVLTAAVRVALLVALHR